MAKGIYIGDSSNKARKVKKLYIGDASGKARKVKKVYIGDANGKARLCWQSGLGKFVVTGGTNARAYSINSSNPTIHTLIPKPNDSLSQYYVHQASTFCLENFVCVGSYGKVFFSKDGNTMYDNGTYQPEGGDSARFVKYLNGKIFTGAYSTGKLRYKNSIEDTTWTTISRTFKYIHDIAYGDGYYCIVYGENNYNATGTLYYAYSTDLTSWTVKSFTTSTMVNMGNICYFNGKFIMNFAYKGTYDWNGRTSRYISTSSMSGTPTSLPNSYISMKIMDGKLYATGIYSSRSGAIGVSTDGVSWGVAHQFTDANTQQEKDIRFTDVAYGDGVYTAIGFVVNSTYNYARCIATSKDNMSTWSIAYYDDSALTSGNYLTSVSFSEDGGTQ